MQAIRHDQGHGDIPTPMPKLACNCAGMRQMAAAGELGSDEEDEDEEEDADFRDAAESDGGSSDADDGSGGSESDSQPGSPEVLIELIPAC